jgi:hypothetical protein
MDEETERERERERERWERKREGERIIQVQQWLGSLAISVD